MKKTSGIIFTSSGSDGRKLGYMRGRDTRKDGFGTIIYVSPNGSNSIILFCTVVMYL